MLRWRALPTIFVIPPLDILCRVQHTYLHRVWIFRINIDFGCFSESLLIISENHKIYIDCFCVRDRDVDGCRGWLDCLIGLRTVNKSLEEGGLSESILILIVSVSHDLHWLFLRARPFRINIDCGCFSESILFISQRYWIYIHCFCAHERDVDGCRSESILIVSVCHRIYIDCFCACYFSE